MYKKILWQKLFNDKNFKYFKESKKIIINPYNLAKIIYPELNKKKFNQITLFLSKNLIIKKKDKLLDFGSGNGAFLLFYLKQVNKLYGMEISNPLIKFQRRILPKGKFFLTNPYNIKFFKNLKNDEVDITLSNSVFHYFYSNAYCKKVLKEMIRVTKRTIMIYDIKDENKKKQFILNLRKRQNLSEKDFYKKYKYTPQRFYKKVFFRNFLKKNFRNLKFSFIKLPEGATDNKFGYCLKITK